MADVITFLDVPRRPAAYRSAAERVRDYRDVALRSAEGESQRQATRCMECGTPFCHWACPLGNEVPGWNRALACGDWERAYRLLASTNNLPEVTARLCPALCESACVLSVGYEAVTNREDELAVIEHAFASGFVHPRPPKRRTGKRVAVVGSGPAGLACADQLNRAGHRVRVFERDAKPGGLLRYGIPDFKLEKLLLDRRLAIWASEGIEFQTGVEMGRDQPASSLRKQFDAVCLAGGCRVPRDLEVPGRGLRGIHFALPYLMQANRRIAGEPVPEAEAIDARGARVVVIGGGDTGADCVGTALRQGARHVAQIELLPRPPEHRAAGDLWPDYPKILRTSTSHEEGGAREWSVLTKAFLGADGAVARLSCVRVEWLAPGPDNRPAMREQPGTAFELEADLVLLAMGFIAGSPPAWLKELGVAFDARGAIQTTPQQMTSVSGVFAAGDVRRGQSLVVHALSEGRRAAHHIDRHLMGRSRLPCL